MATRSRSHTLLDLERAPMRRGRQLGRGGSAKTSVVTLHRKDSIVETYCLKEFDVVDDRSKALLTELQVLSKLKHPGIATFHDFVPAGTLLDGVPLEHPALLFELVDGVNLRELLNSIPEQRLAPTLVVEIAMGLCATLAWAHRFVVHRDISGGNVMVTRAGAVILLDFGVAHVLPRRGEPRTKTMCGKPCYMSPEQAGAFDIVEIDGRSDLFSLGVLLYELLTGVRPFDAPTESETMARAERGIRVPLGTPERAPHAPPELIRIIDKLLQPHRDDRFANARELFDALDRIAPIRATRYELARLVDEALADAQLIAEDDLTRAAGEQTTRRSQGFAADDDGLAFETAGEPASGFRVRRQTAPVLLTLAGLVTVVGFSLAYVLSRSNVSTASASYAPKVIAKTSVPVNPSLARAEGPPTISSATASPVAPIQTPESVAPPFPLASNATDVSNVDNVLPQVKSRHSERPALANLSVTVLDAVGQIWLDGSSVGWSPQKHLKVTPGRHEVAVGDRDPQVNQIIVLRAAESRNLNMRLKPADKVN